MGLKLMENAPHGSIAASHTKLEIFLADRARLVSSAASKIGAMRRFHPLHPKKKKKSMADHSSFPPDSQASKQRVSRN